MTVLIVDNGKSSFRGELTRWLSEFKAGIFFGNISASIRDKIWEKVESENKCSSALLIYSSDTEQGYRLRSFGENNIEMIDFDGFILPKKIRRE